MKITLKSEYSKVSSDFEDEVNVVELTKGFITFVFGFSIKGLSPYENKICLIHHLL